MITENCPNCDSTKIVHRFGGVNITDEQKEQMMCLNCAMLFPSKDIIVKNWKLISKQSKGSKNAN